MATKPKIREIASEKLEIRKIRKIRKISWKIHRGYVRGISLHFPKYIDL